MKRRIDPRSALVLCWSITLVPLVAIVGCFARSDLHQWDMPGHLAAAMLYRDRLWPALLGWNGRDGFGGHPQGYFYPSLFEWVVGGTARLLPLEWAFRGWLALSVLLLPVSLFTFLRACGVPTRSAFPAIWCALATLLVAEPLSLGGFFTATFGGGLVSAQWSLPLVFFHLTVLQRAATAAPGPTRIVAILGAGALLAATLLAHAFNGAGAALLSVIMFPAFAGGGRRAVERLPVLVLQGGVALVLALVWIGPWWSYHELSSGRALTTFPVFLRFRRGLCFFLPTFVLAAAGVVASWRRGRLAAPGAVRPLLCLLGVYGVLGWLGEREAFAHLPLHSYRLLVFVFLFAALAAGTAFRSRRSALALGAIFGVAYLTSSALFSRSLLRLPRRELVIAADPGAPGSRGLVNEDRDSAFEVNASPHLAAFALQRRDLDVLNGVFVESSAVSPYIYALLKELDARAYVGNVEPVPVDGSRVLFHEQTLGVQWVLSGSALDAFPGPGSATERVDGDLRLTVDDRPVALRQWLRSTPFALAELLRVPPSVSAKGERAWSADVRDWWTHGSIDAPLPLRSSTPIGSFTPPGPGERAELHAVAADRYRLDLFVPSPRWAVVKLPYFPGWHALQDGRELPLYEASTHLLAVRGAGRIELLFRPGRLEVVCGYVSAVGWCLVALALTAAVTRRWRARRPRRVYGAAAGVGEGTDSGRAAAGGGVTVGST